MNIMLIVLKKKKKQREGYRMNSNNIYGIVEMTEHEARIMVRDYKKKMLGKKRKNGIVYVLLDLGDGVGYPLNKTYTPKNIQELTDNALKGSIIYVKFNMIVKESDKTIEETPGIMYSIYLNSMLEPDRSFIKPWNVCTDEFTTITPEEYYALQNKV